MGPYWEQLWDRHGNSISLSAGNGLFDNKTALLQLAESTIYTPYFPRTKAVPKPYISRTKAILALYIPYTPDSYRDHLSTFEVLT